MAYKFEKGILKSSKYDDYEKNGFYYFTLVLEVNGSEITASASSRKSTYPIANGKEVNFEIDWTDKKNNKYKGDYYVVKKVKSLDQDNNSSYSNKGGGSSRKDPNYVAKQLKQAAQTTAINFVKLITESGILEKVNFAYIYKYSDYFYNNFYNLHTNDYYQAIHAMNNAITTMGINQYLEEADVIDTKEKLINYANTLFDYYKAAEDRTPV